MSDDYANYIMYKQKYLNLKREMMSQHGGFSGIAYWFLSNKLPESAGKTNDQIALIKIINDAIDKSSSIGQLPGNNLDINAVFYRHGVRLSIDANRLTSRKTTVEYSVGKPLTKITICPELSDYLTMYSNFTEAQHGDVNQNLVRLISKSNISAELDVSLVANGSAEQCKVALEKINDFFKTKFNICVSFNVPPIGKNSLLATYKQQ